MPVRDKRSVSFPPELSRRIAEEAKRYGTTFSGWVTDMAAKRLKLEAGRRAIERWQEENGRFTDAEIARARAEIETAIQRASRGPRGRRRARR